MSSRNGYLLECQKYLDKFRVFELKELLKNMGVQQKGRKQDLYSRAHSLLMHGNPKIQQEIRKIHERSHLAIRRSIKVDEFSTGPSSPRIRMPESKPSSSSFTVKDTRSYVVHPDVKFKPHPFYKVVENIVRPTALVSTKMTSHGNSMMLQFHLTPSQVKAIWSSRNNSQDKYGVQLLLRFARNESSCEQEDFYPKQCYVKISDRFVSLPGYNAHLSVRPEYKRIGAPVNITEYLKISMTKTNEVIFYWTNDILYPQGFCVSVDLVQSLSSSDLLQKLKQKGVRSPDVSRALVREKLAIDRDSEISATSLRVSILCPLGKLRMTHPCRARACTHLQCFDASIYLQMNERKPRWVCPVCDNPAPLESLEIDGLFKEICADSLSNDVGFEADGSWYPILANDRGSYASPEKKCVHLTVEDSPPAASVDAGKGSSGESSKSDKIVIDLTLDTDEEDSDGDENLNISSTSTGPPSASPSLSSNPAFSTDILRPSMPMSVITNIPSPSQSVSSASSSDQTSSSVHSTSMPVSTSSSSISTSFLNPPSSYLSNFSSSTSDVLPFCISASSASNMMVPSLPFLPLYLSSGGGRGRGGEGGGGGELDDSGGGIGDSGGGGMAGADMLRDFASRHVKRRCSSSADDHDNSEHSTSRQSLAPVVSGISARPMSVITEYAPTLPRFNAPTCIIPFLSQPSGAAQTVLTTSSTNALHSGFSNTRGIDGLHQVPSLNLEDSIYALFPLTTNETDYSESINIED